MKRISVIVVAIVCCCSLCLMTGCDKQINLDFFKKDKEEKKVEKEEDIGAPYIGYAPMTKDSKQMVDTVSQSVPGQPEYELLKYAAGENNQAIVRLEKSTKDGTWEVYKEEKLLLTHNVNSGYMVLVGNAAEGITINTNLIELGDENNNTKTNVVKFGKMYDGNAKPLYPKTAMFGKDRTKMSEKELMKTEDRMDLTSAKVLQMNFSSERTVEKDGSVVSSDEKGAKLSDINELYLNETGKFNSVYENQNLLAVTIEFEENEMMSKTPYICNPAVAGEEADTKDGVPIIYDSGEYDIAEVCLEKSDEKGNWKVIGEPQKLTFTNNADSGAMLMKGTFTKDGKVSIGTPDIVFSDGSKQKNTVSFTVPKEENVQDGDEVENIKYEYENEVTGITEREGYIGAKSKVVLRMVSQKKKSDMEYSFDGDEQETLISLTESGVILDDIYKNKGALYNDLYNEDKPMYAVTIKFIN